MTRRECKQRIWAIIAAHLDGDTNLSDDVAGVFHEFHERSGEAFDEVLAFAQKRAGGMGPGPFGDTSSGYGGEWKPSVRSMEEPE